jgi:hypothetical protein
MNNIIHTFGSCRLNLEYDKSIVTNNVLKNVQHKLPKGSLLRRHRTFTVFEVLTNLQILQDTYPEIYEKIQEMRCCIIENCCRYNLTDDNTKRFYTGMVDVKKYVSFTTDPSTCKMYHPNYGMVDINMLKCINIKNIISKEHISNFNIIQNNEILTINVNKLNTKNILKLYLPVSSTAGTSINISLVCSINFKNYIIRYHDGSKYIDFPDNEITSEEKKFSITVNEMKNACICIQKNTNDDTDVNINWIINMLTFYLTADSEITDEFPAVLKQKMYDYAEYENAFIELKKKIPHAKIILVPHIRTKEMPKKLDNRNIIAGFSETLSNKYDDVYYFDNIKYIDESHLEKYADGSQSYNHYSPTGIKIIGSKLSNFIKSVMNKKTDLFVFGSCRVHNIKYLEHINPIHFFITNGVNKKFKNVKKYYIYNIFQIVYLFKKLIDYSPKYKKIINNIKLCVIENCTIYNNTSINGEEHYLKFSTYDKNYIKIYDDVGLRTHYLIYPHLIIDLKKKYFHAVKPTTITNHKPEMNVQHLKNIGCAKIFITIGMANFDTEFDLIIESKIESDVPYFLSSYITKTPETPKHKITDKYKTHRIRIKPNKTSNQKLCIEINIYKKTAENIIVNWIIKQINIEMDPDNKIKRKTPDDILVASESKYDYRKINKEYMKLRQLIPLAKIIFVPHIINDTFPIYLNQRRIEIADMLKTLSKTYDNTFYFDSRKYIKTEYLDDMEHYNEKGRSVIGEIISQFAKEIAEK